MEKLYSAGKAKSIGVSNWSIGRLQKMLAYATVLPAINQIEIHPFFPNTELVDFCFSHNILPVAFSPLGSQLEGNFDVTREILMDSVPLNELAKKKGVSLAQVLIAWGLKRRYAVLPKSANAERVKSNFNLISLTDEEFEAINQVSVGRNRRFIDPDGFGYDVWSEE
jgi:diketogulonate reductase-like aldo/keto reductase